LAAGASAPGDGLAICSVFDERPCTPYFCGVFDGPECIPEIPHPIGQDLRLTVERSDSGQNEPASPQKRIDTVRELFAALRACWIPPSVDVAHPGMEISARFSFGRDGNIIGKPFITYQTRSASPAKRQAYRDALNAALDRCTPLPFTRALGNAVAGRPINVRFIDNRNQQKDGRAP
jgi:hypothetical protein